MFVNTLITASPEFFTRRSRREVQAYFTKDGRLSAKEILGNRAQLSKWQDEFHAHMSKAFPALQRGESALVTKRTISGEPHLHLAATKISSKGTHLDKQVFNAS